MPKTTANQAQSTSAAAERSAEYRPARRYEAVPEPAVTTPPTRAEIPERTVVVPQRDSVTLKYDTPKEAQKELFRRMNRK